MAKTNQEQLVIIDENDFLNLTPENKSNWKGYSYEVIENTYHKISDDDYTQDIDIIKNGTEMTLKDVLYRVDDFNWKCWSGSPSPNSKFDVIFGNIEKIKDVFFMNTLSIKRVDDKRLNLTELNYINNLIF